MLLVQRGQVIPLDELIDGLWPERPPPSAVKSIQIYVSQLRKLLGDGVLETRGRGYVLTLQAGSVDADRFAELLDEARGQRAGGDVNGAAETLRRALALWRGRPFADFAHEPFAQGEIARLDELRFAALEERLDADLVLGKDSELVPEIEALLREQPWRERLRAQQMLALYRAGRQAAALDAYQAARRELAEHLGLEPAAFLQELQRAILVQDPALSLPGRRHGRSATAQPSRPVARRRRVAVTAAVLVAGGATAGVLAILTGGGGRSSPVEANFVVIVNPATGRVAGRIAVGNTPSRIVLGQGSVWVLNGGDSTISRLDPATRSVVRTFALGSVPADIAYGAGALWIANGGAGTVSRIDPVSNTIDATVSLQGPAGTAALALATARAAVWVVDERTTLTRIDPRTNAVAGRTRTLPGGIITTAPQVAVGEGAIWVGDGFEVAKIDPASRGVAAAVATDADGELVAGEGAVWAVDSRGVLVEIDPVLATVRRRIRVGAVPVGVALGGGSVWVANSGDGTISRVDPLTGDVTSIDVGGAPRAIAVGRGEVWVAVD